MLYMVSPLFSFDLEVAIDAQNVLPLPSPHLVLVGGPDPRHHIPAASGSPLHPFCWRMFVFNSRAVHPPRREAWQRAADIVGWRCGVDFPRFPRSCATSAWHVRTRRT